MPYRQSMDGFLSAKIGDAGLRQDRPSQWLDERALAAGLISVDPFGQPAIEVPVRLPRDDLAG